MKYLLLLPLVGLTACQTYQAPARVYYPVEKCQDVKVPIYGVLDRPSSEGEVFGGAIVGAIVGKVLTNDDKGAIVGGLIGGSMANNTRQQEKIITGYKTERQCGTVYE